MTTTKTRGAEVVLHLEAYPKAVRRALRAKPDPGNKPFDFGVVEVRRSDPALGEHGNTTLILSHAYDAAEFGVHFARLTQKANAENELMFRDDDEEEASA